MSATVTGSAEAKRIASTIRSCSASGGASKRLSLSPSAIGIPALSYLDRCEHLALSQLDPALLGKLQRRGEGRRRGRPPPARVHLPAFGHVARKVRPVAR